jgi:hypothetical protein
VLKYYVKYIIPLDFEISSENTTPGENVMLKWDASDAGVVSIDSGVGKVKQSGSVQVSPQRTTKYTLTATGEKGISTAWVIVTVPEKITLLPDLVITGITYNSGLLYYTIKNIGGPTPVQATPISMIRAICGGIQAG